MEFDGGECGFGPVPTVQPLRKMGPSKKKRVLNKNSAPGRKKASLREAQRESQGLTPRDGGGKKDDTAKIGTHSQR